MTSTEENKALVREFFDRLNDHDFDVFDDVCADDFTVEVGRKGTGESVFGVDGMKAIYEEYAAAFPDFEHEIVELIAEDDRVAVFMTSTGTHEGAFRGVEPTGNRIAVEDVGMARIVDGEIVDLWPLSDMLGLFEQLGVGLDL